MKKTGKPVVLGGTPVRQKPFSSRPMVDEREVEAVAQSMRKGLFSRFVGSNIPGTREALRKTSAELRDLSGSHTFFGGPNVRRFEADWAEAHGVPYAIAVNSATSGLTAALMAMDIGPGDEVVTTTLSFTATATAIVAANAIPIFADIDPETLCLSAATVAQVLTPKTRCILPVHWCGNAGDFDAILRLASERGLRVLEDAAQAPGTLYQGRALGGWGDAGVFSFSEPKNVTTGEGGMIITHDPAIASKCRLIRNHGEAVPSSEDPDEEVVNAVGYNFRMVEATAAMGWVQTSKLAEANRIRHENHLHFVSRVRGVTGGCLLPQRLTHPESFACYTAAFRWKEEESGLSRNLIARTLRAEGIPLATGVGRLMSGHPMFLRKLAFGRGHCPFSCHLHGGNVEYDAAKLPAVHMVHDREYLGFFLMGWPNAESDMDDIVSAFEKVMDWREELAEFEKANPGGELAFDRGRG